MEDLEKSGHLLRIEEEVDPYLEMAEIQRRVYQASGPAIFFSRVKHSPFPAVSNLFGTDARCKFLFRSTLRRVQKIVQLKADPSSFFRAPATFLTLPLASFPALPKRARSGPIFAATTQIDQLPRIHSWPDDGGPFITLPQVYTEDPDHPSILRSNLGMYRIQLSGNRYQPNQEVGLHYQIHRGIGVHHQKALSRGEPLKVSIFIGGPPSATLAAVMPLPEGLSELLFAGMLGGRRFRYCRRDGHVIATDADFCITGTVDPNKTSPEGPFGDHLGYYSLAHDFPVLRVESVYHRKDPIWPFTVVGRPPQEDTSFGKLIHDITAPLVPKEIPGVKAIHAVDASGVHPLLLAIGSERYTPYAERKPQEILTLANAILGFGQCSLAKYLFIVAGEDDPSLKVDDIPAFLQHVLSRVDLERDLHFQTRTTMDTLDYSGTGINHGSKLVIAVAGEKRRSLGTSLPTNFSLPENFRNPKIALPGILIIERPSASDKEQCADDPARLAQFLGESQKENLSDFPWVVLVNDSQFCCESLNNFLWVTFTRSNPSHDTYGIHEFSENKHWGCHGSLIIDARIKSHHAPPLIEDPKVTKRVDELAEKGGPLHGIL